MGAAPDTFLGPHHSRELSDHAQPTKNLQCFRSKPTDSERCNRGNPTTVAIEVVPRKLSATETRWAADAKASTLGRILAVGLKADSKMRERKVSS